MTESVKCPDCGYSTVAMGAIPDTNVFAGKHLDDLLPGGVLWRCKKCLLGFRHPQQTKQKLDTLYATGHNYNWNSSPSSRHDWNTARTWIRQFLKPGSSVLDVGCFSGDFLATLGYQYDCYGIEIHPVARERAARKNIQILATEFLDLKGQFDSITAFDVVEHMHSPAAFLEKAANSIRSGGLLIISTGNLDARTFQLLGSRYWYCTIAEHISFISPSWITKASATRELKITKQEFFSHQPCRLPHKVRQAFINITYLMAPPIFRRLRTLGLGGVAAVNHPQLVDHPPVWNAAHDHFIVMLQKV